MSDAVQLIGAAVTALAALLGTVYVARRSREAAAEQAHINQRRTESETQLSLIRVLRNEVNELRDDRNEDRTRIERLEAKTREQDVTLTATNKRLDDAMRRYRTAIKYIRELLAFIAQHAPGQDPPRPPEDLLPDFDS